jgi:adenosylmethionine-8-amino-7-oxononanoate aminotransferase
LRFPVCRAPAFADPSALDTAVELIDAHGNELAAVVVEPLVQAAGGMHSAEPAGFARVADACRRTGVLLICDEVATGFGRTGTLFACDAIGVRPDLLCLGKGITGGYLPMSATVASQRVFDAFAGPDLSELTLYHGHSYGGNALAAAVALRHLQLMQQWDVVANVRARSTQLRAALVARVDQRAVVRDVRVCGLLAGVELDERAGGALLARKVCAQMVRRGVLSRSLGAIITLVPPLTITSPEIERIVDALVHALDDLGAE